MTDAVDSDVDLARWLTTRLGSRHPVAAVVILTGTAASVDRAGLALLSAL